MADQRRTPGRGDRPRGRTGPGRTAPGRRPEPAPGRSAPAGLAEPARAARAAAQKARANPRLTGRAAVLVLVLAVLTVSYASSLKAYLQQRENIDSMKAQIAERQAAIDELEAEKERWEDPAFVEQQARERFGYVMPGETAYVALDEHGNRIQPEASLSEPDEVGRQEKRPWWEDAWASVELAGDPPAPEAETPATRIDGTAGEKQGQEEGQ